MRHLTATGLVREADGDGRHADHVVTLQTSDLLQLLLTGLTHRYRTRNGRLLLLQVLLLLLVVLLLLLVLLLILLVVLLLLRRRLQLRSGVVEARLRTALQRLL